VAVDILGSIPGVGDFRARRLINRFGSLAAVVTAEDDALLDVPGVGKSTVKRIREVTQARAESRPFGPYDSGGAGDGAVSEPPPPRLRESVVQSAWHRTRQFSPSADGRRHRRWVVKKDQAPYPTGDPGPKARGRPSAG
jgi:hypothetical protein